MPKTFPGGIHVPGNKNTKNIPIRDFPAPPQVAIPLQQHIGAPAKPLVNVGDEVKLGQVIADFTGGLSCPVHASVSGTVKAIEQRQAYSGVGTTTHIVIENNFKDEISSDIKPYNGDIFKASSEEIIEIVTLPKFIEKIVQQEIHIPSIDSDRLGTIFSVCTANIINKYIEHEIEISCYLPIINHICKNTKNVRHYKRLINSAFTSTFCNEYDLDIPTLLMLEIIHFEAPKLYEVIQENREYFISSDVMCDVNLYLFQRRSDKFNEEGKAFFDELFDEFSTFKELLCNFFPFIYRYKSGFNLIEKYDSSIPDCIKSDFPIYSIKYFDIYFSLSTNDFAKNISEMQMLMKEINSKKSIKDSVVNKLINIDSDNQRERFEYLDMHIDSLSGSVSFQLINIIWDNILSIDDSNLFFMLNAQQRALVIMAKLIKKLEMDKLEEITYNFKTEYNKLQFISSLIYWLNSDKIGISGEIISLFNKLYSDMCATIVGNKVNLYDRHNYSQHNIYALSRNYQNNLEVIKQYFSDIYRSEYVYKVLADLVGESTGSKGYGYAIDKQNLDLLGVTIAQIANSIETYPPKTESENKLKEIFDKVVNDEKNIFDHFGINSPIPIKFDV